MAQARTPTCTHRWVLGAPGKQTVRGVCRRCGARKIYPSGLEFHDSRSIYEEADGSFPQPSPETAALGGQAVA